VSTTENEPVFYIQVSNEIQGAVVPQANAREFIQATKERLEQIAASVRSAAQTLATAVTSLPVKPQEFGLEFGLSLGGEAGIPYVTKGTVDTNFKVTITWKGNEARVG
jgi:hypothetical protein